MAQVRKDLARQVGGYAAVCRRGTFGCFFGTGDKLAELALHEVQVQAKSAERFLAQVRKDLARQVGGYAAVCRPKPFGCFFGTGDRLAELARRGALFGILGEYGFEILGKIMLGWAILLAKAHLFL